MKYYIVLALVVAVAVAAPYDPKDATILKYVNDNIGVEGYNYQVETSDGKSVVESGVVKNVGAENEAIEVRGSFSYSDDKGTVYTVTYVANENGFQPSGAHLPQ